MLTYLTPRTQHMPHSSSPLNPQRSSSPPPIPSSPTRAGGGLPMFSLPTLKSTHTTPINTFSRPSHSNAFSSPRSSPSRALSTRYTRTMPSSSLSSRRPTPRAALSSPTSAAGSDVFSDGNGATPTQNAMWRDRLQRRMADRERRKNARANDLARRRGTADMDLSDDDDDDEAERQAQADDEELFRRLMVLQRRREQHALSGYSAESVEFWQDELDALAHEERELYAVAQAMDTDPTPIASAHYSDDSSRWASEAAEAEALENEYENEYAVETAHGYDDFHWELESENDMQLGPEDWAAINAMEAANAMHPHGAADETMDMD